MTSTEMLAWGGLAHLVADWIFQNDWMAANKGVNWRPGVDGRRLPTVEADIVPGAALEVPIPGGEGLSRPIAVEAVPTPEGCPRLALCRSSGGTEEWHEVRDLLAHAVTAHPPTDWARPLKHPAGYCHALVHLLFTLLVFPWWASCMIAASHWLVDLRVPLVWWRRAFGQDKGPVVVHVAIWEDQVVHLAIIGLAALLLGGPP